MNVQVMLCGAPVFAPAATVETRLAQWRIPDGPASAAAVNDEAVETDHPLRDGDRVSFFPLRPAVDAAAANP